MSTDTTSTDDSTATPVTELRPGQHVVLRQEVHEVRHVERTRTGFAIMLKRNGRVCVHTCVPDDIMYRASAEQVADAESETVRSVLAADLQMLIDLISARNRIVPVTRNSVMYVDYSVPTIGALRDLAAYVGTDVRTTYPGGQPTVYASVTFPVVQEDDWTPAPLQVRFTVLNTPDDSIEA